MEEQMTKIMNNLKDAHDRKKIYAYKNKVFIYFKVDEHAFKSEIKYKFSKIGLLPKVGSKMLWAF
jgi:hypothetical protein